jgi:hypothetical protein
MSLQERVSLMAKQSDDPFHRFMAAYGGNPAYEQPVSQSNEDDMKQPKKDEQLSGLATRLSARHIYTITCQRKNMGCKHVGEIAAEKVMTAKEVAQAFYHEDWRLREHDGQVIVFCPNCVYSDTGE